VSVVELVENGVNIIVLLAQETFRECSKRFVGNWCISLRMTFGQGMT